MAIIGLTDTVKSAFPRIGRLVKGGEATRDATGKVLKIGPDLDHFRFVSERPEVAEAFEDAYGAAPTLINVYLPYASVEENFDCWREKWAAGGLVHRCDGQTVTIWLQPDGTYSKQPRPCDGGCKEVGRLPLIIPELVRAGFVGYVVHQTHGINDLLSIQGSLLAAWDARLGNPLGLRGIQWILRRVKEKVSTPGPDGKRVRRDKWLVKLEPAADWVQLQLEAAHNATMMLPAGQAPRANGDTVDHETGEIITSTARDVEHPPAQEPEAPPMNASVPAPAGPAAANTPPTQPTPATAPAARSAPDRPSKHMIDQWGQLWQNALGLALDVSDLVTDPTQVTGTEFAARGKLLRERVEKALAETGGEKAF